MKRGPPFIVVESSNLGKKDMKIGRGVASSINGLIPNKVMNLTEIQIGFISKTMFDYSVKALI